MMSRNCNTCNFPLEEGHVLDYYIRLQYYCNEDCLRKDNPELDNMTIQEMYDEDIQYFTTWWDEKENGYEKI